MPLKIGGREFTKQQTIFLSVGAAVILVFLLIIFGVLPGGRGKDETNLVVWVLDEDTDAWRRTVGRFDDAYPLVNVSYEEINPTNYESELINALAAGRGPDVLAFNSKWLTEHGDKIVPAPSNKITKDTFSELFPQVAEDDFVGNDRVYVMPLYIDTLALVYNRDTLDSRGVVFPPKTWTEFDGAVAKIRIFANSALTTKAAAIGGTSGSVRNASDILNLMMLQNGSTIVNEGYTRADLGTGGEAALTEYTKFGIEENPLYTWSDSFGDSNKAFAEGEVAMIFAYPGDIREIKEENPFVDFGISDMPQINTTSPTNFANYWGLAVASGSQNADAAWDFVIFATTDGTSAENYIIETGHAPALRFLIDGYLSNATIGVFAKQALTAKSWREPDDDRVEAIFNDMINSVVNEGSDINDALGDARSALTELLR